MKYIIFLLPLLTHACENGYDGVCDYAGKCNNPKKIIWSFLTSFSSSTYASQNCTEGEKLYAKYRIAGKNCNAFCGDPDREAASCLASGGTWTLATSTCSCPEGTQLVGDQVGDGPLRCEEQTCNIINHQNAGCCTGASHPDCCQCAGI